MTKNTSKNNNIGWRFDNTYSKLPNDMLSKLAPVPVKTRKKVPINSTRYFFID